MQRLTKIAILLILFSAALTYISAQQFQGSFSGGSLQEMGVPPKSAAYFTFDLPNSTVVGFVYFTNGVPVNFLLLNQQGFSSIQLKSNSSSDIYTGSLNATDTIELIYNSTSGIFPYQNASSYSSYPSQSSPMLPGGRYYAVFQNSGGSNATVSFSLVTKSQSQVGGSVFSSAAYGISAAAMFVAGVLALIYSLFSKKPQEPQKYSEEADALYGRIGRARRVAKTHAARRAHANRRRRRRNMR